MQGMILFVVEVFITNCGSGFSTKNQPLDFEGICENDDAFTDEKKVF